MLIEALGGVYVCAQAEVGISGIERVCHHAASPRSAVWLFRFKGIAVFRAVPIVELMGFEYSTFASQ